MTKNYLNLAHGNLRDTIKHRVENIDGGKLVETEDFMLFSIGVDTNDRHLNGVLIFNDKNPKEIYYNSKEFFKDLGFEYAFWIRDEVDIKLEDFLKNKGYKATRNPGSSIMAIENKLQDIDIPFGYDLVEVKNKKEIEDFKIVIGKSFEKDRKVLDRMFSSKEILISESVKSFLIYNREQIPVSAAITSITENAAGIYYIGTIKSERSKGLGKKITIASTNAGFEAGKDIVILQASELGEIVYNKLGYKKIGIYRSYAVK